MRAIIVSTVLIAGCATGPGPGTQGSGNVVINGDMIIVKVFGECVKASSGFGAESESKADVGGEVGADVTTRSGTIGGTAATVFAGTLGALDECDSSEGEGPGAGSEGGVPEGIQEPGGETGS